MSNLDQEKKSDLTSGFNDAATSAHTDLRNLAAGLAHDFNNALAAIRAFVEVAAGKSPEDGARRHLESALAAIDTTAARHHSLLDLARNPQGPVSNTSGALQALCGIITHTLAAGFRIDASIADALWALEVSQTELETAVYGATRRLCAEPSKCSVLSIHAQNVHLPAGAASDLGLAPGDYVRITLERKPGARIGARSHSTPARTVEGPSACLHLPRSRSFGAEREAEHAVALPLGNGETVLVVSRDDIWLEAAQGLLESLAYTVVCASTVAEALPALTPSVHAVMCETQLLDTTQCDMAAEALARVPSLRVILVPNAASSTIPAPSDPRIAVVPPPLTRAHLAALLGPPP